MKNPTSSSQTILHLGASAAIFKNHSVLLVKRATGVFQNFWSLPGGHRKAGESALQAAVREVLEETGLSVSCLTLLDQIEVQSQDSTGMVSRRYLISVFYGLWQSGELCAATDAKDAGWFEMQELHTLTLTEGADSLIRRAYKEIYG